MGSDSIAHEAKGHEDENLTSWSKISRQNSFSWQKRDSATIVLGSKPTLFATSGL